MFLKYDQSQSDSYQLSFDQFEMMSLNHFDLRSVHQMGRLLTLLYLRLRLSFEKFPFVEEQFLVERLLFVRDCPHQLARQSQLRQAVLLSHQPRLQYLTQGQQL